MSRPSSSSAEPDSTAPDAEESPCSAPPVAPPAISGQLTPEQFHNISRTLADPRRFAMLQQIAGSDHLLCGHLDVQGTISPATISHHLRELQEAGLVEATRSGRQMLLRLRRDTWDQYLRQLQTL